MLIALGWPWYEMRTIRVLRSTVQVYPLGLKQFYYTGLKTIRHILSSFVKTRARYIKYQNLGIQSKRKQAKLIWVIPKRPYLLKKRNVVLVKQENQLVKRCPKLRFHQLLEVVIFFMLLTLHDSLVALTSLELNTMWVQWLKKKT